MLQAVGALGHPNIAGFVAAHEDRAESGEPRFSIIAPLYTGGELFDRIIAKGHFSEKEAASVFAKVASGLALLHDRGIIHRCVLCCAVCWWRGMGFHSGARPRQRSPHPLPLPPPPLLPPPPPHAVTSSQRMC